MSRLPAAGSPDDTIFALAAGGGGAAISVMRVSGAGSAAALAQLAGDLPPPRLASLRNLRAGDGSLLDRGLVLWFPAPRSYTGEDVCELHLHGGRAVARAVAEALGAAGCRPAEPGEFTRRAFLAGRMDLLEAEAIGDLVAAETESQRVRATAALAGGARSIVQEWSDRLLRCLAHQEALIDFPDETADAGEAAVIHQAQSLSAEIDAHLARAVFAERVRQGVRIAIVGAPNVGKSSLLNALARREAAIVSAVPGTTRDVIEVHLDLGGVAVTLFDTAGLRDTDDLVEREGIRRTHLAAAAADIVLHVMQSGTSDLSAYPAATCLVVHSKADLAPAQDDALAVSAHSGFGLERLRERLAHMARALTADASGAVLSHARQTAALRDVRAALEAAILQPLAELRGEDLRVAMQCLGRLTGRVDADDVLDVVFGSFCIGK